MSKEKGRRGNLVLSRYIDEEIVIADPSGQELITIKLIEVRGKKARIGVQAPGEYRVDRREVFDSRALSSDSAEGIVPTKGDTTTDAKNSA